LKKISAELLETIKTRIVEAIRPEKIILFGSHAWGIPGDDSDIDLYIVVAKSDQPAYKKAREVYRALRGVNVPIDVIIQSHDEAERSKQVATSLGKKVAEEGVLLYG